MKISKFLLIICVLLTFVGSMQAAFTVFQTAPFTARVSISGSTNYGFVAQIYKIETGGVEPLNLIWWTNINAQAIASSPNPWRVSMDFIKVSYSNGGNNWGLAVSSWNTNAAYTTSLGGPKYTGPVANAAALIQTNNPASASTLPLVWQIQDSGSYNIATATPTPLITPPVGVPLGFTNTYWMWKYLLDQSQPAWVNTSVNSNVGTTSVNYYAIANYNNQRLFASGPGVNQRGATSSPNYIFVAADFAGCSATVYKTTALMLQMYHP